MMAKRWEQLVRDTFDRNLPTHFDQALADRYAAAYPDGESGTDEWGSLDDWLAAAAGRSTSNRRLNERLGVNLK